MQDDEVLPTDEIARLAALRRQQQASVAQDSNIVQVGGSPAHGVLHEHESSRDLGVCRADYTPP